jgi:hypothetical protein
MSEGLKKKETQRNARDLARSQTRVHSVARVFLEEERRGGCSRPTSLTKERK